mgnify:FL=1
MHTPPFRKLQHHMRSPRALSVATTVAVTGGTLATLGAVPAQAAPESDWDKLAQCESSGNWAIDSGNGFYGGLQFTQSTWSSFGGTGQPQDASREQQIAVAENVLAGQGWGAWPACSSRLGLSSAAEPVANPMAAGPASTSSSSAEAATDSAAAGTAVSTQSVGPRPTGPIDFRDVTDAHWASADIDWASSTGVIVGHRDGTYRPDADVTRADFLTMLYRLAGQPEADLSVLEGYTDSSDHHQKRALAWAVEEGLINGWGDGTLRPDAPVDSTALGLILHRSAGAPAHTAPETSRFQDVSASQAGYTELDWLHDEDVLPDTDGRLGVGDGITRAEAVSVLNAAVAAGVVADDTEQTPWGSVGAASGSGYETSAQAQAQAASNDDTTAIDVQSITDGASSADGKAIVETAMRGLGGNYVWGGTAYKNWDCSGFTQWVYAQNGVSIPRVTWQQFGAAQKTSTPQVGDLVSQNNGSHVGIYLGDGLMISALNPDQGTLVHPVNAMKVDGFYTFL